MTTHEKLKIVPRWAVEDPNSPHDPRERKTSRWVKLVLGGCIVSLLAFVAYTKTPSHVRNCFHHQLKHSHAVSSVLENIHKSKPTEINREQSQKVSARHASYPETCTTSKCKQWADLVKTNLASNYTAIDPCEDFSSYACNGWRATHDWRPDQASVSIGSVMSDTIKDTLHALLDGTYPSNTTLTGQNRTFDQQNFEKMKAAYNTCMNEEAIKSYGVTPVVKLLEEFDKIYPANGPAPTKDNRDELTKAIIWLAKNSVSGLVGSGTGADDSNPDVLIIALGPGEVAFAKQYYNKSAVMANYTKSLMEMQNVLDTGKPIYESPITEARSQALNQSATAIMNFEKLISNNTPDPEKASEVKYYYQPRTLAQVQEMVPHIDLVQYLAAQAPDGYPITPNRTVILSDTNFYAVLPKIIEQTPRETIQAHFKSRLIRTWAGRLHKNYTLPVRQLSNIMGGKDPNTLPERWRTCVSEVDGSLGLALSAAFIEHAFTKKDKEFGDRVISDIKKVFADRLHNFEWMSESVKDLAAKKVVNIIQKVGYQTKNPNVEDPQQVFEWYSKLAVNKSTNWFENGRAFSKFGYERSWRDLLKPVDRDRWGMSAPTVNAYYNPSGNEIVFPAGIMQFPVFGSELPEYVSYGSFGAVAGHELTHGFDDHGSEFDENGVLRNWWDNTTRSNFDKKTQCFVKQYEQFTVPGLDDEPLHVNGKLTLGENIADAGGLSAAYAAWKARDATQSNPGLPGLEQFNKNQLFFLSYATWWCGKVRKAQAVNYVYTDPHSPADKRIIGTTANSAAFKEAFNCKVRQPTCELW